MKVFRIRRDVHQHTNLEAEEIYSYSSISASHTHILTYTLLLKFRDQQYNAALKVNLFIMSRLLTFLDKKTNQINASNVS